jgi:hypothetical protein
MISVAKLLKDNLLAQTSKKADLVYNHSPSFIQLRAR